MKPVTLVPSALQIRPRGRVIVVEIPDGYATSSARQVATLRRSHYWRMLFEVFRKDLHGGEVRKRSQSRREAVCREIRTPARDVLGSCWWAEDIDLTLLSVWLENGLM